VERWQKAAHRKSSERFSRRALAYAAAEKAAREERERFHREWESEQRRRLTEEERRQREESRWKFLLDKIEALERAQKIERFVRTVKTQLANTEAASQLDRFLDWSKDYAATLRKRCYPDDLDAAIAVAGLFKPENNRSGN
jgi:hypothetical protein